MGDLEQISLGEPAAFAEVGDQLHIRLVKPGRQAFVEEVNKDQRLCTEELLIAGATLLVALRLAQPLL